MEAQSSKKSVKDRIKPHIHSIATHAVMGVIGGATVYTYYKNRTVITWCHLTMDNIDYLKKNGQGVIGFGMDTKEKILFALPDKV